MVVIQSSKKVKGYLVNDDFINYVLNPSLMLTEMWDEFFQINPDQITIANEAIQIITGTKDFVILPKHESELMKKNIFEKCVF